VLQSIQEVPYLRSNLGDVSMQRAIYSVYELETSGLVTVMHSAGSAVEFRCRRNAIVVLAWHGRKNLPSSPGGMLGRVRKEETAMHEILQGQGRALPEGRFVRMELMIQGGCLLDCEEPRPGRMRSTTV
jgi:hypothetical protein